MQLCFITLHSSYFAQAVLSWFEMIPPAAKSIFTMQEDRHFNARIERAGALQFLFPLYPTADHGSFYRRYHKAQFKEETARSSRA